MTALVIGTACVGRSHHAAAQTRPATGPAGAVELRDPDAPAPLELGDIAVATEGVVPADLPVLLWLDLPDKTDRPRRLWLTGPSDYLEARRFVVRLTAPAAAAAEPRTLKPGNGQFSQGRLSTVTIAPGGSLRTPIFIEPLPAGEYAGELHTARDDVRSDQPERRLTEFKLTITDSIHAARASAR